MPKEEEIIGEIELAGEEEITGEVEIEDKPFPTKQTPYYMPAGTAPTLFGEQPQTLMGLGAGLAEASQMIHGKPLAESLKYKPKKKTKRQKKIEDKTLVKGSRYYDEKTKFQAIYKGDGKWQLLKPKRGKKFQYTPGGKVAMMIPGVAQLHGLFGDEDWSDPSDIELKRGMEGEVQYEETDKIFEDFNPTHKMNLATGAIEEAFTHPAELATGLTLGAGFLARKGLAPVLKNVASEFTLSVSDIGEAAAKKLTKKLVEKGMTKEAAKEIVNKGVDKTVRKIKSAVPGKKPSMFDDIAEKTTKKDTKDIIDQFKVDDAAIAEANKFKAKDAWANAGKWVWDDKRNVRKALEDAGNAIRKQIKSGKVPEDKIEELLMIEKAAHNAVEKRVLMHGSTANTARIMDDVEKKVFKDMSQTEIDDLGKLRESLRTAEIAEREIKGKVIKTRGGKKHESLLEDVRTLNPEAYERLMAKNSEIQELLSDQLRQLEKSGLITGDQVGSILSKGEFYNPRVFLDRIDPITDKVVKNQKLSESGLPYLETGSEKILMKDPRYLVQQYVSRIQSRIAKNEASKALHKFMELNPENGIVRLRKKGQKLGPKEDTVNVMIDGKKKEMVMRADLAEEWKGLDPLLSEKMAKGLSWVTGNKILKTFATGVNPMFAARNLARDMGYLYMSPQYSSFLPRFVGQAAADYGKVFKDAVLKKGRYVDYIKQGGGLETLTEQGRLFDKKLKRTQDVLGALGEFSERWSRLAHRNRAIKNGLSEEAATFTARDALDFGQGGTWAKAANNMIPYFNAGIQGTRGMIKFAKKDPKKFAMKVANLGALSGTLYAINTINYKDDYEKIPDRVKADNWIIMLPTTTLDRYDEEQRDYITIPKDQSQRIFTAFFENVSQMFWGHDVSTEQTKMAARSLTDLLPAGESGMSPLARAMVGYTQNIDMFRDKPIWEKDAVPLSKEWHEYTPEIYKKIGEMTGEEKFVHADRPEDQLSPERMRYIVSQFVTNNNMYANFFGLGLNEIMKGLTKKERALKSEDIRRALGLNMLRHTTTDYQLRQKNKDIGMNVAGEKLDYVRDQNELFKAIEKEDTEESRGDMTAWIREQPALKRRYLKDRYKNMLKLNVMNQKLGKQNYKWWMDLITEDNPQGKALMFYQKWKRSSDKYKKEMLTRAKGFYRGFGKQFFREIYKIDSNWNKKDIKGEEVDFEVEDIELGEGDIIEEEVEIGEGDIIE